LGKEKTMTGKVLTWLAIGDIVSGAVVCAVAWLRGPTWLALLGGVLLLGGAFTLVLLSRSTRL